ncbi:hypothetical protein GB937_001035 [Aspergillus fischeri]|nr:hypothetical protein GB937_001035 [Aspergillus fischeri]
MVANTTWGCPRSGDLIDFARETPGQTKPVHHSVSSITKLGNSSWTEKVNVRDECRSLILCYSRDKSACKVVSKRKRDETLHLSSDSRTMVVPGAVSYLSTETS